LALDLSADQGVGVGPYGADHHPFAFVFWILCLGILVFYTFRGSAYLYCNLNQARVASYVDRISTNTIYSGLQMGGGMMSDLKADAAKVLETMAITVFNSEESLTRFRNCLVRDVVGYKTPAVGILEDVKFRAAVFPLSVKDGEVGDDVNPIWGNDRFILPAVAALARLYDAVLSPSGQPCFDVRSVEDEDSVYGLRLEAVTPRPTFDRDRAIVMISGASKAFLTDIDQCHLARWAMSEYR